MPSPISSSYRRFESLLSKYFYADFQNKIFQIFRNEEKIPSIVSFGKFVVRSLRTSGKFVRLKYHFYCIGFGECSKNRLKRVRTYLFGFFHATYIFIKK